MPYLQDIRTYRLCCAILFISRVRLFIVSLFSLDIALPSKSDSVFRTRMLTSFVMPIASTRVLHTCLYLLPLSTLVSNIPLKKPLCENLLRRVRKSLFWKRFNHSICLHCDLLQFEIRENHPFSHGDETPYYISSDESVITLCSDACISVDV